jgi:LysM repeat protein
MQSKNLNLACIAFLVLCLGLSVNGQCLYKKVTTGDTIATFLSTYAYLGVSYDSFIAANPSLSGVPITQCLTNFCQTVCIPLFNTPATTTIPTTTTTVAATQCIYKTVQSGDTIALILSTYAYLGVTYNSFIAANPNLASTPVTQCLTNFCQSICIPYCNSVVPTVTIPTTTTTTASATQCLYKTVQSGDTIASILSIYAYLGVTYNSFIAANPNLASTPVTQCLTNFCQSICIPYCNSVVPTVTIPTTTTTTVSATQCIYRTIQAGDTIASILSAYSYLGVTYSSLIAANPNLASIPTTQCLTNFCYSICIPNCNTATVTIPTTTTTTAPATQCLYKTVQSGDTIASILSTYAYLGVTYSSFIAANPNLANTPTTQCLTNFCQSICIPYCNSVVPTTTIASTTVGYATTCGASGFNYVVGSGDTCASLINSYVSTNPNLFYSSNPTLNCASLTIGQLICVPGYISKVQTCSNYVVKQGDTCYALINNYSITNPSLFFQANPLINCANLQVGSSLCLPNYSGFFFGSCSNSYTIVAGDMCYTVMNKLSISMAYLYSCNSFINTACTNLQPGQILKY